ncbi:hypothetical protein Shal_1140 [Shewanella halifaxensis HAW-EB4]|uniref:Periplasmic protein n=1 Tax=Shewanella halifaxensis (strain HAW-EB4) TaxID=458817 RepID=B0TJB8_SHEHH|nr:TapY2 family type IVa secretion system protein [Shewanella halifaxensis]ABZ75709.1 hypothetical protein Shal_1140 [Shewanella halifaxensis HAW-EB4]
MIRLKYLFLTSAAALLFPTSQALAVEYQEYKCHVVSSKKGEQVVFYRWKVSDFKLKFASLPGKQLTDHKGKKYFIRDATECVPLTKDFSSEKARRVDERTLR